MVIRGKEGSEGDNNKNVKKRTEFSRFNENVLTMRGNAELEGKKTKEKKCKKDRNTVIKMMVEKKTNK